MILLRAGFNMGAFFNTGNNCASTQTEALCSELSGFSGVVFCARCKLQKKAKKYQKVVKNAIVTEPQTQNLGSWRLLAAGSVVDKVRKDTRGS